MGDVVPALIVGGFVGFAAGYLGSIMISKRMALVGDALSHVALPGLALGILFGFSPFVGAFVLLAATAVVTWYLQKSTELPVESIVGVLFVLALAVGILITPQVELYEALFGDISLVTLADAVAAAAISVVVVLALRAIYGKLALTMISRELAVSSGVKVDAINLVYLLLVSTVVAVGIKEVGTLLVGAVVIVPAAAARNISSSLSQYSLLSGAFGVASAMIGVLLSAYLALPAGPIVVLAGASLFGLGLSARLIHLGNP
ncbi:MAG: metal ABC transporter permease [Nitrososphaerota archaeon]|nr:metal ABC transporter permease [Nitrososphaerota archaeon]MDG7024606.1 metal ABC transporter permease [Nitrososphaerota archaeon]